jgi:hypothetical protein
VNYLNIGYDPFDGGSAIMGYLPTQKKNVHNPCLMQDLNFHPSVQTVQEGICFKSHRIITIHL